MLKQWVKIQTGWYRLIEIGRKFVTIQVGDRNMVVPKIVIDACKLDYPQGEKVAPGARWRG